MTSVGNRVAGTVAAAVLLATMSVMLAPQVSAAEADRCAWLPSAVKLARSVEGVTDPRAVAIRERLQQLGVTAQTEAPSGCADTQVPEGGTEVCEKFGSTPVPGGYEVQNDVWGSDEAQCVRAFATGFEVLKSNFANDSGPAAYPSIFTGCHYGTCTEGTTLPQQVSALPEVTTSWSFTVPEGHEQWDAAYDIWFDPTPRTDGTVTGTEMMIWFDHTEPQPIGERTATVELAGRAWDVWVGENGAKVVSYVATDPTRAIENLPLKPFIDDAIARGSLGAQDYLTSIQAGFEPWTGGAGLTTTSFSVTGVTQSAAGPT